MTVEFKNTTEVKTLVVGSGSDTQEVEPGETIETSEDEVEGYLERGYGELVDESSDDSGDEDSGDSDEGSQDDGEDEVSEFRGQLLKVDGVDDDIAAQIEEDYDDFAGFYEAVTSGDADLTEYKGVGDATAEDIETYIDENVERE